MTALTKLFRTTTFRLSLTYLALFSAAAIVAIFYIYWNTTVLLSRQLNQTIDAELKGLAEQYRAGGLDQLVSTVAERSQTPGNSLYLVADSEGRRLAGNLSAVSPELWNSLGPVEFVYRRPATGGVETTARLRQCVPAAERLSPDRRPRYRGPAGARAHRSARRCCGGSASWRCSASAAAIG